MRKILSNLLSKPGLALVVSLLLIGVPVSVSAGTVGTVFTYQGNLTDGGSPANGQYDFEFKLFDDASGGAQIGSPIVKDNVDVTDGFFSVELDFGSVFNGQALYLEIGVRPGASGGAFNLFTGRQELTPTPYALGLRPGAVIEGSGTLLSAISTGGGPNPAAVYGESNSNSGRGVFGKASATSGSNSGVRGETTSTNGGAIGVYGLAISSSAAGSGVKGQNNGVDGYGVWGQGGSGATGVLGQAHSATKHGVWAYNSGAGVALRAENDSGNIIEAWDMSPVNRRFYVSNAGDVVADAAYSSAGADFAEVLPAAAGLEPAEVLVIGPDGKLTRSSRPFQTNVVGVYSTKPGFVGGSGPDSDLTGKIPLAVVGIVPVKASAENGAIHPGDSLTSSATPGHAMRADSITVDGITFYPSGVIIGKALENLDKGSGVIQMLVILQ